MAKLKVAAVVRSGYSQGSDPICRWECTYRGVVERVAVEGLNVSLVGRIGQSDNLNRSRECAVDQDLFAWKLWGKG